MNFNKNIKQVRCVKVPNLMLLCNHYFAYLFQVKILTLKSFQLCLLVVFHRSNIWELNEHVFQKFESSLEVQRIKKKKKIQRILVIIFWNFTMLQYRSDSPQVKQKLIFSIANLVYELPHELPNDLRLRILGNQEKLEKFQILVETQHSTQSPFKNLYFVYSC